MPRSFALGERFEAFIDAQVRSGRYNNASEVVRDGLRRLEDDEAMRVAREAEWREAVAVARRTDTLVDGEAVFDRLEAKYQAQAQQDKTGS